MSHSCDDLGSPLPSSSRPPPPIGGGGSEKGKREAAAAERKRIIAEFEEKRRKVVEAKAAAEAAKKTADAARKISEMASQRQASATAMSPSAAAEAPTTAAAAGLIGVLRLRLSHGSGLKAADKNGLSDPYVKLTHGKHKFTSRTVYKSLNPKWDQEFTIRGSLSGLLSEPLQLKCWDYDSMLHSDPLGEATLDLRTLSAPSLEAGERVECAVTLRDGQPTPGQLFLVVGFDDKSHPAAAAMSSSPQKGSPPPPQQHLDHLAAAVDHLATLEPPQPQPQPQPQPLYPQEQPHYPRRRFVEQPEQQEL